MPACPRCQITYESGARFCQQCGSPLPQPEPPGAGEGPVSEPVPAGPTAAEAPQPPSRRWNLGLLALGGAVGAVLIFLALFLIIRSSTRPPEPPSPALERGVAPEADLQQQLAQLLVVLREAQINKDLTRYMDCYALAFPGREEKRQTALKAWQAFDFTAMFFYLEDVKAAGPEAAQAKVIWDFQVQDKRTGGFRTATQTFRVEFVQEQGAWRIRTLEEISAP